MSQYLEINREIYTKIIGKPIKPGSEIPDYCHSFLSCWTDVLIKMEDRGWSSVKITLLPDGRYHVKFWRETPVLMCIEGFGDTRAEAVCVTALNAIAAEKWL